MTNLRDIRRRLRSVENIKKITDAMERVAAARLRRAQIKAEQSVPYVVKLKEILENLAKTDETHPLFTQRPVKKTALIVISSDKGLSGSYNTNLLNAADKFLKNYDRKNADVIAFGRKAVDHYKKMKWPIQKEVVNWGDKITYEEIVAISNEFVDNFLTEQYDEIWIIYTEYISIMKNAVKVEKFLNIGKPDSEKTVTHSNYIYEPDTASIYNEILPRYCSARLQAALNEAYASELASRIVAMQKASNNSENMIQDLTLTRNKIRQESITKEIIEISVSA